MMILQVVFVMTKRPGMLLQFSVNRVRLFAVLVLMMMMLLLVNLLLCIPFLLLPPLILADSNSRRIRC
jgi:hypothetical protein